MKKYNITVNGKVYEVDVEEISVDGAVATPAPSVAQQAAAPAPAPAPAAKAPVAAGSGEPVNAPMPGKILKINKKANDSVNKGDVVIILEAMKMENEIKANKDGVISSVAVSEGQTVDTGQAMLYID